ncbi:MAG: hypothetical protein WCT15_07615 [Candidatus Omnitrophota bacterium]
MSPKSTRLSKRCRTNEAYNVNNSLDILIERLKKIRALNGDPAFFGMDNYVLKRMNLTKVSILTRS